MTLKKSSSIFSRALKQTFNQNKYMSLTGKVGNNHTHLGFYSYVDTLVGRVGITLGAIFTVALAYGDPDYFHETFGHIQSAPKFDLIDYNLSGEERRLNQKILKRQKEEHKLDAFLEQTKSFEL